MTSAELKRAILKLFEANPQKGWTVAAICGALPETHSRAVYYEVKNLRDVGRLVVSATQPGRGSGKVYTLKAGSPAPVPVAAPRQKHADRILEILVQDVRNGGRDGMTAGDIAKKIGVSRQGVDKAIRGLVESGAVDFRIPEDTGPRRYSLKSGPVKVGTVESSILRALKGGPLSVSDMVRTTGTPRKSLENTLWRLVRSGEVKQEGALYFLPAVDAKEARMEVLKKNILDVLKGGALYASSIATLVAVGPALVETALESLVSTGQVVRVHPLGSDSGKSYLYGLPAEPDAEAPEQPEQPPDVPRTPEQPVNQERSHELEVAYLKGRIAGLAHAVRILAGRLQTGTGEN